MKIIAVSSMKGGVGKSSLAVFLAQALAAAGHRVLAADLDPNNNLTDYFLREGDAEAILTRNVFHVLKGEVKMDAAVYPAGPLAVLPCTQALHRIGNELGTDPGSLLRFRKKLEALPYAFAVLDSPPALGYELRAALYAADLVLSPVYPHRWGIIGHSILCDEARNVAETTGRSLPVFIVPYMVSTLTEQESMGAYPGDKTQTLIPRKASIRKRAETGKPLSGRDRETFAALAAEVIRLLGGT